MIKLALFAKDLPYLHALGFLKHVWVSIRIASFTYHTFKALEIQFPPFIQILGIFIITYKI